MIARTDTMTTEIGIVSQKAAVPAARSVNMIASVAYATEDRLSLENTASALGIDRRSAASSSLASGRPNAARRAPANTRPSGSAGAMAAGRAVRTSFPA
jgi:hypothetical protein